MEIMTIPKRPGRLDDAVLEAAVSEIFPAYSKWCGGISDSEIPSAWASLKKAIRWGHDGYNIVKELENSDYISGDSELVEIMDGASHAVWNAETNAVKAWRSDNSIFPPLTVGITVKHPWGTGRINSIDAATARYIVGDETQPPGCGTLVPYEDALVVADLPAFAAE